jgi:hypothetical protein
VECLWVRVQWRGKVVLCCGDMLRESTARAIDYAIIQADQSSIQ